MKEPGWKTIESRIKYKKISINFVDQMHNKNFLRSEFDNRDDIFEKVMKRLNITGQSFGKLFEIITSKNYSDFKNTMNNFQLIETDIMIIFTSLFAHLLLEEYEFLKNSILFLIKKETYDVTNDGKKKKIDGSESLGLLLSKLQEITHNDDIKNNLNLELRNAIGHGKWYIENQQFCYEGKSPEKEIKKLSMGQLFVLQMELKEFVTVFYEEGFQYAAIIKKRKLY